MAQIEQLECTGFSDNNRPPKLCRHGQLFGKSFRRAIDLGSTDDSSFWVVTIRDVDNELIWVQFNNNAINVTDALPRLQSDYTSTEPFLKTAARSLGTYSTFTFDSPIAVDFIAATICSYMHAMFPGSMDALTWVSDEFNTQTAH